MVKIEDKVEKEKRSYDEMAARYIYTPTHKTKIGWDIFIAFVYFACIFDDSFFTVMGLYPLVVPSVKTTQTIFSFVLVLDMIFTFFTAFKKEAKI